MFPTNNPAGEALALVVESACTLAEQTARTTRSMVLYFQCCAFLRACGRRWPWTYGVERADKVNSYRRWALSV